MSTGDGTYPSVAPGDSPQVGLDTNGKYPANMRFAVMDQGRLFFAYPQDWTVTPISDDLMSLSSADQSVQGEIRIRPDGPVYPPPPDLSHTRTVYGQAQSSDHAAGIVAGRQDGPFGSERLNWRLADPHAVGVGMAIGEGRVVDAQFFSVIGSGNPRLTEAQIEQKLDAIQSTPEQFAAQNILANLVHLG